MTLELSFELATNVTLMKIDSLACRKSDSRSSEDSSVRSRMHLTQLCRFGKCFNVCDQDPKDEEITVAMKTQRFLRLRNAWNTKTGFETDKIMSYIAFFQTTFSPNKI